MCKGCLDNQQLRLNPGLKLANAFGVIPTDSERVKACSYYRISRRQVQETVGPARAGAVKTNTAIPDDPDRAINVNSTG